jgi:hypothetical protein
MRKECQTVSILFVIVVLAGCRWGIDDLSASSRQRSAIEAVVNKFNEASNQWTNSMVGLQNDLVSAAFTHELGDVIQKYHDDLVAIDVSGCPEDFRIAFVNYYQAVLGFKEYANSITGWNGALKGVANGVVSLVNLHGNTDKAADPLVSAGNQLELVCTKYGVDIK